MNCPKTVIACLNSSFKHTMLSARCLKAFAAERGFYNVQINEYTVNNEPEKIIRDLFEEHADIYAFPSYIFNIEEVCVVVRSLRLICPTSVLIMGGPEPSYNSSFDSLCDFVITGEGEKPFVRILEEYGDGMKSRLSEDNGLRFTLNGSTIDNGQCSPLVMNDLPFPYDDLESLKDRILYYESSRGCPFMCSYCLSSRDKRVRLKDISLVFPDLQKFIDAGVEQVKFVDRTFNCDAERTLKIWKYISDHDNGVTSFHFEIAPWLLDEEQLSFLKTVRKGLFRFEIGIQSSDFETLKAIDRPIPFEKSKDKIEKLADTNVSVHLDLIFGLPGEGYVQSMKSIDDVMALPCDVLQLGFLKSLYGTKIHDNSTEMVFSPDPPYEVLFTDHVSYEQLSRLKKISYLMDLYFNSGLCRFIRNSTDITGMSVSSFLESFSEYLDNYGFWDVGHKQTDLINMMFGFLSSVCERKLAENLCALSYYMIGRPGAFPDWMDSLPEKGVDIQPEVVPEDPFLCKEKSVRNNSISVRFSAIGDTVIFRYGRRVYPYFRFTNCLQKQVLTNEVLCDILIKRSREKQPREGKNEL